MKTTNSKTPLSRSIIALAAIIAVWAPPTSWSAEPAEGKEMKMKNTMMENCEETKMEEKMMKHMMGHLETGKESMSKFPMMKEMNEKSDDAHAEHHQKSE